MTKSLTTALNFGNKDRPRIFFVTKILPRLSSNRIGDDRFTVKLLEANFSSCRNSGVNGVRLTARVADPHWSPRNDPEFWLDDVAWSLKEDLAREYFV